MPKRAQPIGLKIKQINTVFEKDFNIKLKSIGVTSSQCAVLDFLFNTHLDDVSQRDIEQHLSLKNPTVTGIVRRLEEKGFILSVQSNQDKRKNIIHLTEKAYDVQRRMEAERKKMDKILTRGMTAREIESLNKQLNKIMSNIDY